MLTAMEALARIEVLRFSELPIENSIGRLAIICVAQGAKPAFMGEEEGFFEEYKETGKRLGLKVLVTGRPPPDAYPSGKPRVPAGFVRAFHEIGRRGETRVVWLFGSAHVSSEISRSVSGLVSEGVPLGYPRCCIRQYDEDRRYLVERAYRHVVSAYHAKNEREAIRVLLTDPPLPPPRNAVIESFREFPFISHIACRDCLSGASDGSSRLNAAARAIAEEVGLTRPILDAISLFLSRHDGEIRGPEKELRGTE